MRNLRKREAEGNALVKQEPIDVDALSYPSRSNKKLTLSIAGDDDGRPPLLQMKTQTKKEEDHLIKDEDVSFHSENQSSLGASSSGSPRTPKTPKTAKEKHPIHLTTDGEQYIELSQYRRVTVRRYSGRMLIDLREFYEKDGVKNPGKKGISLTLEQARTPSHLLKIHQSCAHSGNACARILISSIR
ncbi:hypothetical protein K439DRAFT_1389081 [Ramaria rubella]|nr:hypothetical protein K439DRAFT_1389081 [Ramaria rubella]